MEEQMKYKHKKKKNYFKNLRVSMKKLAKQPQRK